MASQVNSIKHLFRVNIYPFETIPNTAEEGTLQTHPMTPPST